LQHIDPQSTVFVSPPFQGLLLGYGNDPRSLNQTRIYIRVGRPPDIDLDLHYSTTYRSLSERRFHVTIQRQPISMNRPSEGSAVRLGIPPTDRPFGTSWTENVPKCAGHRSGLARGVAYRSTSSCRSDGIRQFLSSQTLSETRCAVQRLKMDGRCLPTCR